MEFATDISSSGWLVKNEKMPQSGQRKNFEWKGQSLKKGTFFGRKDTFNKCKFWFW